MSTQFAFRADQITAFLPANSNWADSNSSVIITRQPTPDPISDAINNLRFACTGFGGHHHGVAQFNLLTRHTFIFRPQTTGRLTAHTHFMPQGGFSLVGRASTWWFDRPGAAAIHIDARMRVRVLAADGTVPLNKRTPEEKLFEFHAEGGDVADTNEGAVESELLEFSISRTFETVVVPTDTVEVQARYDVYAIAHDGAEFALDFASTPAAFGEPGDGLNAPFAVINIS